MRIAHSLSSVFFPGIVFGIFFGKVGLNVLWFLYLPVISKVVRSNHFLCKTVVKRRDFRVAFPLADFNQQFSDLNAKFLKNMD